MLLKSEQINCRSQCQDYENAVFFEDNKIISGLHEGQIKLYHPHAGISAQVNKPVL